MNSHERTKRWADAILRADALLTRGWTPQLARVAGSVVVLWWAVWFLLTHAEATP